MPTDELSKPGGLTGERGLLAAVVQQAVKDATGKGNSRADAWRYITARSGLRHHLDMLDMPWQFPGVLEGADER